MTIDLSSRNSLVGDKLDDRSSMHGKVHSSNFYLRKAKREESNREMANRGDLYIGGSIRRKYVMKLLIRVACKLNRNSRRTKRRDD